MIILTNTSSDTITINDLALELQPGDSINMLSNYTKDDILNSNDIESIYNSGSISFSLHNSSVTLYQVIKSLIGLTEQEHEGLDTLTHSLSEKSFFTTEKNSDEDVVKIVYYNDSSLALKLRDEEIIRNIDGDVERIVVKQYDYSGNVYKTETQNLNRNIDGVVESIESITT